MNYEEIQITGIDGLVKTQITIDLGNGEFKSFVTDELNPEYVAFLKQLEAESAD